MGPGGSTMSETTEIKTTEIKKITITVEGPEQERLAVLASINLLVRALQVAPQFESPRTRQDVTNASADRWEADTALKMVADRNAIVLVGRDYPVSPLVGLSPVAGGGV